MAKATVKYTGPSVHRRVISKKDFKSKDIEVDQDVVLSPENGHEVSVDLSEEALALLEKQANIKVTRSEEPKKPAAR